MTREAADPMIAWGVIRLCGGQMHIVPCSADGALLAPHRVVGFCPCGPKAVRSGPLNSPLLVHRMPGHGDEPTDA